ncbi:ubiquitin carboxyl-terminal hydrolase 34 isoform X5 [Piliocolobus tephrosceles]|uniref:ubiquitin carboxyl-terminal hydrolase 34 isoform X5 n=1 Tax=Piliocolobus tephrosceles TaxID=591936 RepID=UPI000C2A26B5|nr:ubiquitin carboxyl-terminal hydrolase 34 isoform X5 [Piliocolobus tephrosceles]
MCENCADLVEVLNEISDVEGGDGLQLRKEHTLKIFTYINSWTQSPGPAMSQKQEENPVEEIGEEKRDTQEKEGILPKRAEEAKLKAKYPSLGQKSGGSDFLMKRLQKGQKYFDSGGYNMAKAEMKNKQLPRTGPDKNLVTGDHIPTPQDLPQRKSSLVTSKLAGGQVE